MSSRAVADKDHRAVRSRSAARRIRPSGDRGSRASDGGAAAYCTKPVRLRFQCRSGLHRKRGNAAADVAVPRPRRSRFGRRNAKLYQSRRGVHTAVKPAGGDWAAVDRVCAPLLYSTAIRSTGVGWAMGLGRLGSFVGPLAIGLLVNRGWQIGDCFAALEMAALCAALFTSVIGINRSCEAAKADRVTAATGEEL